MLLLLPFLISLVTSVSSVHGTVHDKKTMEPLTGVKIVVNDSVVTYTDFNGNFILRTDDTIKTMKASMVSYSSVEYVFNKKE